MRLGETTELLSDERVVRVESFFLGGICDPGQIIFRSYTTGIDTYISATMENDTYELSLLDLRQSERRQSLACLHIVLQ